MSIGVPQERTHLSADALFGVVRSGVANIPDDRLSDPDISLTDARMAAFALCSLKSPALLAFDKERAAGNLEPIYGIERVPCDTQMRERRDPVSPESLRPVFTSIFRPLPRGKALESMACLEGHSLVALEGTGSCSATQLHGASCRHKVHRHGSITYAHQLLGAAISHPDVREVLPLMPEPRVTHDGTDKHAWERHAAKRVGAKRRQDHPHLKLIVIEDGLSANAPHIETLHDHDLHSIRGVTEGDHAFVFTQGQAAEHAGRVTQDERHDRAAGLVHRFRFGHDVPLKASNTDVRVNCIAYWAIGADKVQHFSWVTDWRVRTRTVFHRMRGGRARWKIEHETCNTLKHQGDNFEHHDGQGQHNLSVVLAMVMLRAFLVDQTPQRCCALFQAVWATLGSKRLLWERMRAWFSDDALESMRQRLEALLYGLQKPNPIFAVDSSSSPSISAATTF